MTDRVIVFVSSAAMIGSIWGTAWAVEQFDDWRKIPLLLTGIIVFGVASWHYAVSCVRFK